MDQLEPWDNPKISPKNNTDSGFKKFISNVNYGHEIRVFGPPGTGKTNSLSQDFIPWAIDKYGADKVLVTSFTRMAAREVGGRTGLISEQNIGTLHALCFKILGQPKLAHSIISEWNDENPVYPLSGSVDSLNMKDAPTGADADQLLATIGVYRSRRVDKTRWPDYLLNFHHKWEDFKEQTGSMDFTDLIEVTLKTMPYPPNNVKCIFVDEAQDFTPLQLDLVRSWNMEADCLALFGDDDQCVYSFQGATPGAFLYPEIPIDNKLFLSQSYRVPQAAFRSAQIIVNKISRRELKDYRPTSHKGEIIQLDDSWTRVDNMVSHIVKDYELNRSIMVLGSCAYMLQNVRKALFNKGVPFHNPQTKDRVQWNPLARGGYKKVTATDALIAFTNVDQMEDPPYWSVGEFLKWVKKIRVGDNGIIFRKGNKVIKKLAALYKDGADGLHTTRNVLFSVLTDAAAIQALAGNVDWFTDQLKGAKSKFDFPLRVIKRYNERTLRRTPKLVLGTIHSAKGGESEIIYLFPDIALISLKNSLTSVLERDSLYRLFYVGITRTSDKLILLKPASVRKSVRIE